jgi:hypothetical protein
VIKMMDSILGPTAVGVGATVLAALTDPPEDEYARQWHREAAHYQHKRTAALAARGQWITVAAPVSLRNGTRIDTRTRGNPSAVESGVRVEDSTALGLVHGRLDNPTVRQLTPHLPSRPPGVLHNS